MGPTSTRQRNAILMAFRWRADDGPLIVVVESSLPSSKKNVVKVGPSLSKFSGSAHEESAEIGEYLHDNHFIFYHMIIGCQSQSQNLFSINYY